MAREILTIGGQIIGTAIGGPIGGAIGGIIGGAIGNAVDPIEGPGIGDRKVQISTYGANRAMLFGTTRTAGILEWAADLEEGDVGGKGGPPAQTVAYGTFMVTLGRTRCKGIRKAWANGVLVYDDVAAEDKPVADPISFAFYPGDEEQLPDPTMESYEGVGNVPAYRGISYVVINRMDLSRFGNRLPSMEFEVVAEQEWVGGTPISLDSATAVTPSGFNWRHIFYRQDGTLLLVGGEATGQVYARAYDPFTETYGTAYALAPITSTQNLTDAVMVEQNATLYACIKAGLDTYVYEYSLDDFNGTRNWIVNGFSQGAPFGNAGGYMAYDPYANALNLVAESQFSTYQLRRIDLNIGRLGKAVSASMLSYSTGIAKGGRVMQIQLAVFGFVPFAVTPPLIDGKSWAPKTIAGELLYDVETRDDAFAGRLPEVGQSTLFTEWPTGGATSADYPRAAFDTGRSRYVVVDRAGKVWTVTDEIDPVVTLQATVAELVTAGQHDVMYMSGLDAFLVVNASGQLFVLDAVDFSLILDGFALPDASGGMPVMRQSQTDPGAIIVAGGPLLAAPYRLFEQPLYSSTVGAAVRTMGLEAGYEEADLDVSELTQRLRGFRVVNAGPLRPAVEQLASVFHFEGAEEDDQIVFKMRGRASVATFTADECVVQNASDQPIAYTRAQEATLPRSLSLTAPDMLSDYQPLTQPSKRQAVQAGEEVAYAVDVVLTPTECKRAADALIFDTWMARETSEATLTAAALRLTGGDVVTIAGRRARIVGKTVEDMAVRLSLVADDEDMLAQSAAGVLSQFVRQNPPLSTQIAFEILHAPLLRDEDDNYGGYWACWARTGDYNGARLLRARISDDGDIGRLFETGSEITPPGSSAGIAVTALSDWDGRYVVDESSFLAVRFFGTPPASCTRDDLIAGANAFMVGAEMIHAMNVVAQGDGTHKLSGLLRVCRGTERFGVDHAAGEIVVALTTSTIGAFTTEFASQGVPTVFAAYGVGASATILDDVTTIYTARRLVPVSPVNVRGARDAGTGDITITWYRRSRYASSRGGALGVVVPLGETAEAYVIEILDGGTVVRTATSSSPTYTYTAADQTTDFGAPQSSVDVRIAQTSTRVPAALQWNYQEATV